MLAVANGPSPFFFYYYYTELAEHLHTMWEDEHVSGPDRAQRNRGEGKAVIVNYYFSAAVRRDG